MTLTRFVSWIFTFEVMIFGAGTVCGQDYPNRPIRLVTAAPGGGTDFVSRILARGISRSLGQQIVVDNRPTRLIGELVASAPPDGYTLVLNGFSFWLTPLLVAKPTYDVPRDFAAISLLTTSPTLIVVHPSLPVTSVKELIALAKARPGVLNYGSSTPGAPTHLAGELFKSMTGTNIVGVPYKGNGPALNALIAGEVEVMFSNVAAVSPHVKSGRLRALAVASAQPSVLAPGLPPVSATVPGYDVASTYGIFAPKGTPEVIINRLNQVAVRFLNSPSVREQLLKVGVEVIGSAPERLAATVKSDLVKWGKVIEQAGIRRN